MNRQIKFRGYSNELKSWVYGFFQEVEVEGIGYSYIFWQGNTTNVRADSVGEFVNIYDKNNECIFEVDILELPNGTQRVVEWLECGFVLKLKNETIWQNLLWNVVNHYTVVGNIHECK